ncbi:YitT family protein [Paenibacillus chondroitinus]|uniref:YitT family protein n=1 Tax=Paenibacillus chondroitinus TaxID=59842 RepID=A0ABU6DA99_9BACL|nr:YitT family protein [Paenibacillus chondroitinus]MCY9662292.1 YitT family protein [Paenibacillus anseongense]MEB4794670.1 YitT family protein [Paenibacillus chondroitinus]
MKRTFIDLLFITVGALAFALGINVFVIPHELGEGGVVGITIILYYLLEWSPGWTSLIINLLLLAIGCRLLTRKTVLYTLAAVSLHSLFLHLTQGWHIASNDLIVNSIFGGVLVGFGIGLIVRVGGTTAGTVIIAKLMNKFWDWNISFALLLCDVVVAMSSYFIIGPERLMFTIIMLFVATKVMEFVIDGLNPTKSITIISKKQDQIAQQVNTLMDRGVTVLSGHGYYTKTSMNILYIIVKKQEVALLKNIVKSADHEAFMTVQNVQDVFGKGFVDIQNS